MEKSITIGKPSICQIIYHTQQLKKQMKAFYDNYLDIQNEYREQIVKNFGKYEGYIRFDNLFIRSDQCTKIYIECSNNSNAVQRRV